MLWLLPQSEATLKLKAAVDIFIFQNMAFWKIVFHIKNVYVQNYCI